MNIKQEHISKLYKGYTVFSNGIIIGLLGKPIKPKNNGNGYLNIGVHYNGEIKYEYIHRIVATLFIPNPYNKKCVNHINGIKADNRVENLEWVAHSENTIHAYKNGLWENQRKSVGGNNKRRVVNLDSNIIYASAKEAALKNGFNYRTFTQWLSGYRKNKTNFTYF